MDISDVKKIITEVLSESETKRILKEKLDKAAEEKARMLLDKEEDEERLEKVVESRINKELSSFKSILSKYVNETVQEFISKHEQDFKIAHDKAKINYILESLATVAKVAGVTTEQILEGKQDIDSSLKESENTIRKLEQRISNLKEQLTNEQSLLRELQNKNSLSENAKIEELKNALIEEGKKSDKLERTNSSLKEQNEELNEKNKKLINENKSLNKENDKIIQMGIIDELKSNLSLTESHKFEKCAMNIPFKSRKDYVLQLKELKESIKNEESLNEVYPEEEKGIPNSMKRFI